MNLRQEKPLDADQMRMCRRFADERADRVRHIDRAARKLVTARRKAFELENEGMLFALRDVLPKGGKEPVRFGFDFKKGCVFWEEDEQAKKEIEDQKAAAQVEATARALAEKAPPLKVIEGGEPKAEAPTGS